jgi:protein SCO1/2
MLMTAADAHAGAAPTAVDPHAAHHQMMSAAKNSEVKRVEAPYLVPHVTLLRDDGAAVRLDQELSDSRPVVLSFIFTTCTTICPMTSQILSMLQQKLGDDRDKVHLVSISIDPEQDTPARLREYAARFKAGPEWRHYTGTVQASITAQRAFNVYETDKANHQPVTLVRSAGGNHWVRFEGFASADQLLAEVRGSLKAQH